MPNCVIGSEDTTVSKSDKTPAFVELSTSGEDKNKQGKCKLYIANSMLGREIKQRRRLGCRDSDGPG